jgi:hypothetical protein
MCVSRSAIATSKVAEVVAWEAARHPGTPIETFATDEHRITGDAAGLGTGRRTADRARPSSVRMALCHGVRFARHRRSLLVRLERRIQAVLRGAAAPVCSGSRRGTRSDHHSRARHRRLAIGVVPVWARSGLYRTFGTDRYALRDSAWITQAIRSVCGSKHSATAPRRHSSGSPAFRKPSIAIDPSKRRQGCPISG